MVDWMSAADEEAADMAFRNALEIDGLLHKYSHTSQLAGLPGGRELCRRSMHISTSVDSVPFSRPDQAMMGHANRVQRSFELELPKLQEFS